MKNWICRLGFSSAPDGLQEKGRGAAVRNSSAPLAFLLQRKDQDTTPPIADPHTPTDAHRQPTPKRVSHHGQAKSLVTSTWTVDMLSFSLGSLQFVASRLEQVVSSEPSKRAIHRSITFGSTAQWGGTGTSVNTRIAPFASPILDLDRVSRRGVPHTSPNRHCTEPDFGSLFRLSCFLLSCFPRSCFLSCFLFAARSCLFLFAASVRTAHQLRQENIAVCGAPYCTCFSQGCSGVQSTTDQRQQSVGNYCCM